MKNEKYLKFNGFLFDNLEFSFIPGWEVGRINRTDFNHDFSEKEKSLVLETLTDDGIVINQTHPIIRFAVECETETTTIKRHRLCAYIPLNPKAAILRFRKGDFVLYENNISRNRPFVKVINATINNFKVQLIWESKGMGKIWFNVAMVVDKKHIYPLIKNYEDNSGTFDIAGIPSGKSFHFVVIATDGIRSSFSVSKKMVGGKIPPNYSYILTPAVDEVFPADQGISYCGNEFSPKGEKLSEENLIWKLNGKEVSRGKCTGTLYDLPSGEYKLELISKRGKKITSKTTTQFKIAHRSQAQKEYLKFLEQAASA